jgi:hypothetical protein
MEIENWSEGISELLSSKSAASCRVLTSNLGEISENNSNRGSCSAISHQITTFDPHSVWQYPHQPAAAPKEGHESLCSAINLFLAMTSQLHVPVNRGMSGQSAKNFPT